MIEERSSRLPLALRSAEGQGDTLAGHFAVFDEWTEIDSWEGRFLERIAPGAFADAARAAVRVLFQHGRDPMIGDKVLGPLDELGEDGRGAYYAAPLLDTAYNAELRPGLAAGLYGSSFRFQVTAEDWDRHPSRSLHNPDGLPERTVRRVKLFELGPVTFPAYAGATAGMRDPAGMGTLRSLVDGLDAFLAAE